MRKMDNIKILKSAIKSSQGDLKETIKAIKNNDIKILSKEVYTLDEKVTVPYFLIDKEQSIYEMLKKLVCEVIEDLTVEEKKKTAVIFGSSQIDSNTIKEIEKDSTKEIEASIPKKTSIDYYAKKLSNELLLNDFTMTISTACTSSANGLLEAKNLIDSSVFEYVVVIGMEFFSDMMSNGFSSMKLLSLDKQRPFDENRDGLVLGEAISAVLLGKGSSLWSLNGGYSNCNSITITSVGEDGEEFTEVMQNALNDSNIKAKDITAIKAHATSSLSNDLSEINAISKIFENDIVFTAIKPYIGHTLGACGVLELAILMDAIDNDFIPKTINYSEPILEEYQPISQSKKCSNGTFMLNYFGFGGNNTSLIITKEL